MKPSLEVIKPLGSDDIEQALMPKLSDWYEELRALLPNLPEHLQVYFVDQDDPLMIPELGLGGYAYSQSIMSLGYLLDFEDRETQEISLRGSMYHEGLHMSQGYTGDSDNRSLLECMVYEGVACVFEREYVGAPQPYAAPVEEQQALFWVRSIAAVGDTLDRSTYIKWAFYDEESGERWRLYRTGVWLVDRILKNHDDLDVLQMANMDAQEILAVSDIELSS